MPDREILGPDGGDAVKIGKIVDDEVTGLAGGNLPAALGIKDSDEAPGREPVATFRAGGVGLAGKLGHAIFVVNVLKRDIEKFSEIGVEFWLREGVRGSFVTSGFQKPGASGEGEGAEGFHEVKECQSGAHEEDRAVVFKLLDERGEMESGVAQEEV